MKEFLARISAQFSRLSSAERWFIIIVIIVVFAVINFVFIFPHANDWSALTSRMNDAQKKLRKYEDAIAEAGSLSNQVARLEGAGAAVPQEDQAINFLTTIQSQAAQSGVNIVANTAQPQRTNQFFLERVQAVRTDSNEEQLVDFLYNLGAGGSLIRVRALSVQPDPPHYRLSASATLVASFQKKPPARPAPAPARPAPAPAKKPEPAAASPTPAPKPTGPAVPAPASGSKPATPIKK
jgi:type II secretory pathway component PulM